MSLEQERFYHCRNKHCRSKLAQSVEIRHHAFCSRNCFVRFYRHHCLVCGKETKEARSPDSRNPTRNFCSRSCKNTFRRNPSIYAGPGGSSDRSKGPRECPFYGRFFAGYSDPSPAEPGRRRNTRHLSTLCGTDSAHHQAEAEKRKKYEASLLQAEEAKRTGQTRRPVGLGAGERVGTAPDLLEVQCPRLILRLCAASTSASMVVTISIFPHRSSLLARRRIRRGAWHVGATELLHEAAGDPALREVFRLFQPAVEVGHVVHIDPLPCLIADVSHAPARVGVQDIALLQSCPYLEPSPRPRAQSKETVGRLEHNRAEILGGVRARCQCEHSGRGN